MIPKIIHYCWFGKEPLPNKVKECMKSWEEHLSEYKIMLWNEASFDVNSIEFTKQAYEMKKYAFVSDYVRIYALYHYGGIYLDTDIEIRKTLDFFLEKELVLGTDDEGSLITALMASRKNHYLFKEIMDFYHSIDFILEDGSFNVTTNNVHIQKIILKYGYVEKNIHQLLACGGEVYPDEYFHAKSLVSGEYHITDNTYAIHHHTLLWVPFKTKLIRFLRLYILVPILGKKRYIKLINNIKRG